MQYERYIPPSICNLGDLKKLDLSRNELTGTIPSCIFNLQALTHLDLSQNYFQGKIPHRVHFGIDSDPEISVTLNLSNNNLHGPLPVPPQNSYLFDLSNNKFSGEISMEAGLRLSGAKYVSLSGNKLVGSIPSTFCRKDNYSKPSLSDIDLSNNQLSGPIPSSVGNCLLLESLNLGWNNISGNVPNELGHATRLTIILLNDNNLNGSFPNLRKLQNLEFLNLGKNNFGGNRKLEDVTNSGDPEHTFDVAYQLKMVIKETIVQFKQLHSYSSGIDLSCNILEGNIPEAIGLLKGVSMLNLSYNHLSGRIPHNVGYMTGTHFDTLSLDGSAFAGNNLLCGFPTQNSCESEQNDATGSEEDDQQDASEAEDAKERFLFYSIVALGGKLTGHSYVDTLLENPTGFI
ncbi:receptor-like protein 20 [Papaver somniferum]|uniref:receptor-like protein 20 n=1 Tax=Papaver somniferum TaxID=3469 RepID=UPI000E704B60|nr:receptor-like protein 20 [Papaver somniferum]